MTDIIPTEEQKQAANAFVVQQGEVNEVIDSEGQARLEWLAAPIRPDALARFLAEREAKLLDIHWTKTAQLVDNVVYYRNLAIILGAKPQQMVNEYDRKLCADGIDPNDDGNGYHISVAEVIAGKEADFDEIEALKALVAELEASHEVPVE